MVIRVDRSIEQPLYQQIAQQVRGEIRHGHLPVGAQLPTIRQMAADLGVTRPTVEAAYDELRAGGWIETTVGRGTFVARTARPHDLIDSLSHGATPQAVLENMPRIDEIQVVHSLAYAQPDETLFPMDDFWGSLLALRSEGADLMRYGHPQGDPGLRIEVARLLRERGVEAMPNDVMITSGATQAITLSIHALTRHGDYVLVDEPTHVCLLNTAKTHNLQTISVPMDEEGPRLDIMERIIIQQRPRCYYTAANFQNPTGQVMSMARRRDLLALAKRYGLMIVEDDVYGQMAYDDDPPPALKAMDEDGLVIYASSFSKALMNGLRVGYMVAPKPLHNRLLALKHASNLSDAPLIQRALTNFLKSGKFKAHLRRSIPVYRERRDALLRALSSTMPPGVSWTEPAGGVSAWVTLPPHIDSAHLCREVIRQGFAFTPGDAFYVTPSTQPHIRVCFGTSTPYEIAEAVRVLGELIRSQDKPFPSMKPPLC